MVNAHTKCFDVWQVVHLTLVINVLCSFFAMFGVPQWAVSYNGTAFVSDEIPTFYERNIIQAIASTPYHPEMNGQAER